MTSVDWPSKEEAERWEIQGFIDHYRRLPGQRTFDVVRRQEQPDWIVRDISNGELVGVELTTVYLDDRSVPDWHKRDGGLGVPYRREEISVYEWRVATAVQKKVRLARNGYDSALPLMLSVYANEYVTSTWNQRNGRAWSRRTKRSSTICGPLPKSLSGLS